MLITEYGCRPHNCNACKYHYNVSENYYTLKDVEHRDLRGFVCAAFAEEEGIMVYMSGLVNESTDHCEMFKLRGEK